MKINKIVVEKFMKRQFSRAVINCNCWNADRIIIIEVGKNCDVWSPNMNFSLLHFQHIIWNHNGNWPLKQFSWMLKDSIEINCFVVWKIYRIIKELKDRKKPQVWKPIATVNKSRYPDLLFANRTLLKNFLNFPSIIKVFLVNF